MQKLGETEDIKTETKLLEKKISKLKAKLADRDAKLARLQRKASCQGRALEVLPFGILVLDDQGKSLFGNQAFYDFYGSDHDVSASTGAVSPEQVGLASAIRDLVERGRPFDIKPSQSDEHSGDDSCSNFLGMPFTWDDGKERGSLIMAEVQNTEKGNCSRIQSRLVQMRRIMLGAVESMSKLVELRDPFVTGHQDRVARLACAIAVELGMVDFEVEGVRVAALLHELGKIGIPSEILCKPGALNSAERGIVQTHPLSAHRVLKRVDFQWPVADIVLQHQERMDGSGYPHGLKGEEILLQARIIGLADMVEAMLTLRPYRPAFEWPTVRAEIEVQTGKTFDEKVCTACLRLFDEQGFMI